jgi:hypothetical protein
MSLPREAIGLLNWAPVIFLSAGAGIIKEGTFCKFLLRVAEVTAKSFFIRDEPTVAFASSYCAWC